MNCPNCGGDVVGRYCAQCGQRAVELKPTVHELLHEAFHELSHVDGKILRTAKLLLAHPGMLTKEFFEGKRARSVSPIRLYLLCSLLFFFVASLLPSKLHVSITKGNDAQIQKAAAKINRDPEILAHALTTAFPKLMFVLMPMFGLIVWAFYFKTERMYVPHLYFAIHYHAFAFVMLAIFEALGAVHSIVVSIIKLLIFLTPFPYLAIALRRVYGGTRGMAAAKTAGIMTIYLAIVLVTMAAIVLLTMRHMQV